MALNLAPKKYRANTPPMHPTVKPASSVIPLSTPRLWNMGEEKWILPAASADLMKSFPANSEAAYCGYESGR